MPMTSCSLGGNRLKKEVAVFADEHLFANFGRKADRKGVFLAQMGGFGLGTGFANSIAATQELFAS